MVGRSAARVVAILTRAPSAGGKHRLFAELGRPQDPDLLEALLLDTLDGVADPRWQRVVVVEPADACAAVAAFIGPGVGVMSQPSGTLGARMRETMALAFALGAGAVVLIGSDLPAITAAQIDAAFDAIDEEPGRVVLGPATDGGFYLIGGTAPPPALDDIVWSRPTVLDDTVRAMARVGVGVRLLEPLDDVDSLADLRHLTAIGEAHGPQCAPRTRRWAAVNLVR